MTPRQQAEQIVTGDDMQMSREWWIDKITTAIQAACNDELERGRARTATVQAALVVHGAVRIAPGHSLISDDELASLRADRERAEFMAELAVERPDMLRLILIGMHAEYLTQHGVAVDSSAGWRALIDAARGVPENPAQATTCDAGKDGQR